MNKVTDVPQGRPLVPGINDDIGEELRLRLYRTQFELREAEQRAFDLFLQNLVKGSLTASRLTQQVTTSLPHSLCS